MKIILKKTRNSIVNFEWKIQNLPLTAFLSQGKQGVWFFEIHRTDISINSIYGLI
jgi:hypothetical protein